MRIIEVELEFDGVDHVGFRTKDGTLIVDYGGVDHRDNPTEVLNMLTNMLKEGDELVEMADGSDTIWYGILRAK
jgi:hypothetical protein